MSLLLELDADGYPTEESLKLIAEYPIRSYADCATLLTAVREVWTYPNYWTDTEGVHEISTGGWSGNESLIGALQDNHAFWVLTWQTIRRGGHFTIKLPGGHTLKLP